VQDLHVEIDRATKTRQMEAIIGTEEFQELCRIARCLRDRPASR
jgi:hypothetical protein